MPTPQEQALAQIVEVLAAVDTSSRSNAARHQVDFTRLAATIERLAPNPSQYRAQADVVCSPSPWVSANGIQVLADVLRALKADIEAGYLRSVEELVHADVFDGFLEMAEELHSKGFLAPAAVLAGSVLEGHLRKVAIKAEIDPAQSVEQLGIALVRMAVFSEPQRKVLSAWYAQRTEAAHGRPENVIAQIVGQMIPGIRDFIVRYPA